jgi:hypothetical protein
MGCNKTQSRGFAKIVPTPEKRLDIDLQKRLDFVLSRAPFSFVPQSVKLTDRGVLVSEIVARILKATPKTILITIPKHASETHLGRAECIRQSLKNRGCMNDIIVTRAVGHSIQAVTIAIANAPTNETPNIRASLTQVLRDSPILFAPNKNRFVSDCLPVIQRCAELLAMVKYMTCVIEVYASGSSPTDERVAALLSQKRAEYLSVMLQECGATTKFKCVGYGHRNLDGASPQVVMTLVEVAPEDQQFVVEDMDPVEIEYNHCQALQCKRTLVCGM